MSEELEQDMSAKNDMHPVARVLFGWTTGVRVKSLVLLVLAVLSGLLLLIDLQLERHAHTEAEALVGFYALYGFVSFAFVVLMGWPLGKLLRRSENYYNDQDETELSPTSLDDEEDD